MRVALVGTFPLDPSNFGGGVETSTWNLIEGLSTFDDMEIHLVTGNSSLTKDMQIERDGVLYHYFPSSNRFQTMSLYRQDRQRIGRILSQIQPDVVHAQNSQNYGYICLKTDYPVVISIHGIVQEEAQYIAVRKDRLRSVLRSQFVQRYCVRNAPHVIQPTRYPEHYFKDLKTGKWHDTGNAIASRFFDCESATEPGTILYSGAIIPRKRLLDLVMALDTVRKRCPSVSLRIAGVVPDKEYLRTVQDWIDAHDLRQAITFLGSVSQDSLVKEYEQCALLVLPSGQETSPMVIAEAMAVGKPVVATHVGGVPYLIDEGETGFVVEVGDIDQLANRITTVLSDDELQRKMGRQAKEKASRNYRREIVAMRIRDVYSETIATYNGVNRPERVLTTA